MGDFFESLILSLFLIKYFVKGYLTIKNEVNLRIRMSQNEFKIISKSIFENIENELHREVTIQEKDF